MHPKAPHLIIGGDSTLGSATYAALRSESAPVVATTRRRERVGTGRLWFDLVEPPSSFEPPGDTGAAVVFAGISRLSDCANDPEGSSRINVDQTLALIERLIEGDIYTLFLSTNRVFDGTAPHMPENAPLSPVSEYGRQKACVEKILARHTSAGAPVGILRLSKVLTPDTGPFHEWGVALRHGENVRAFHDMVFSPVPVEQVTRAIKNLLHDRAAGVFQLSGSRDISYAEVTYHLAQRLGVDSSLVKSVSAESATLPEGTILAHTTLASEALGERYGIVVPDPLAVLDAVIGPL